MSNLITASDLRAAYQISTNVADADLNRFIATAQKGDFAYILGDALYYALTQWYDTEGSAYKELFEGVAYINNNNHSVYYDGVKDLLVWMAVKVFLVEEQKRSTRSGIVKQRKDNSEFLSSEDLNNAVYYVRGNIIHNVNRLREYLAVEYASFPEFDEIKSITVL